MAEPACRLFKPAGIPARNLEKVSLTVDELEALRLADYEGLYHEQAAAMMNVSRQTFGRIVSAARARVATALLENKALNIGGGVFEVDGNGCSRPEGAGQRAGRKGEGETGNRSRGQPGLCAHRGGRSS